MENLGIFYDHLVYFTAIANILWPFGIFCGQLVYFSPFWYFVPRKIWQPCRGYGNFLSGTIVFFVTAFQLHQSDQIGRIFASSANVYFAQCLENERIFWGLISWIPTIV
jgi:hypothetical protein